MMKARAVLALVAMVGIGWAASGCSNSCDDLEDECNACGDATRKNECLNHLNVCKTLPDVPGAASESDCCDTWVDSYSSC